MKKDPERNLVPGHVDPDHLAQIITFTGIQGEKVKKGLELYFVSGDPQPAIVDQLGINESMLARKIREIQGLSKRLEAISRFYR